MRTRPSGPGRASSTWSRCAPPKTAWCCSSCSTPNEVRSLKELDIEKVQPTPAELKLALQLIDQIAEDTYDPTMFVDEEKQRILAAIDAKIAGKEVVAARRATPTRAPRSSTSPKCLRASLSPRRHSRPARRAGARRQGRRWPRRSARA